MNEMIESELAFNQNGEPFAVPEDVTAWRIRRLRGGRGAPELVYAREGGPLVLGIDAGMDELREAVDVTGRYRLDAIDDDGKAVANVPPSYVQVTVEPRNSSTPQAAPVSLTSTDHVVRELAHANAEMMRQHTALAKEHTELVKVIATQQPELMRAAADILRAADGAGLPRREPYGYHDEDEEFEDDDTDAEAAPPPKPNMIAAIREAAPLFAAFGFNVDNFLAACGVPVPKTSKTPGPASSRKAPTQPQQRRADSPAATASPTKQAPTEKNNEPTEPAREPFVAENPMAHLLAIQAQLAPEEQAFVKNAMSRLSPSDLMEWRDRIAHMPVDEAVAEIRSEIDKIKQTPEEK